MSPAGRLSAIDATLLRNLLRDTIPAVLSALAATTVVALLCASSGAASPGYRDRVALWWTLLSLGQGAALLMGLRYRRRPPDAAGLAGFDRGLLAVQTYTSLLWGATPWLLLPAPDVQAEAFLLVALAMVVPGAAGMMATYRRAFPICIWGISLPAALGLLRLGGSGHALIALGFVLLGIVVQKNCRGQERAIRAAIQAELDATAALRTLAAQQSEIEAAGRVAELARAQAEAANQAKTAFLAAAGHDLRQPMHAIVQYFAHVRRHNQDARLDPALAQGAEALESMQELLDSVLEVSRLMMGGIVPEPRHLDLAEVLRRVDTQLRPAAGEAGLALCLDLEPPCWVHTDAVLIERICRNLGMNALRYTARGEVRLRLRRVGGAAQLSIADTGVGIARVDWERVFEPFLQLRNPARDRTRGLGLGLTIVRELCALLGVRLRLRSRPGQGTVFRLRLPLVERPGRDTAARNPEAWRHLLDGALVLVIDDDARSREATALTLRDFGCEVVTAASSLQALAAPAFKERLPTLILSDYRLEHETGLEAIARVRSGLDEHFGDRFALPGLLFSGDTAPEQLRRVRDAGLQLLHKPVAPELLRAALERELAVLAGLAGPLGIRQSGI